MIDRKALTQAWPAWWQDRSPLQIAVFAGILTSLSLLIAQGIPYLFDWDELIYASLARHMLHTGNGLELMINQAPFWEKPPLFFWLQAVTMQGLGVSEAAARFPNAIAGGLTTALVAWIGARYHGRDLAVIWAVLLGTSLLPLVFAKTGLIDPLFNLLMLAGLIGLFESDQAKRRGRSGRAGWSWGAIALGLAVLAKGPLGLGLPIVIWIAYKLWHPKPSIDWQEIIGFSLLAVAPPLIWLGLEISEQGTAFAYEFTLYQWRILTSGADHPGPIWFHLLAYGIGCFPFAALSFTGLIQVLWPQRQALYDQSDQKDPVPLKDANAQTKPIDPPVKERLDHLLLIGFLFVLAFFSILVQTKLVHYTSLLYPLGSYFAALRLQRLLYLSRSPSRLEWIGISFGGGVWILLLLGIPWIGQHRSLVIQWVDDPLTEGYLSAPVDWPWWTYGSGVILLVGFGIWVLSQTTFLRWRRDRRIQQGWIVLLLASWISTQGFWMTLGSRMLDHSQGGAIRFVRLVSSPDSFDQTFPQVEQSADLGIPESSRSDQLETPLAWYGLRSFIPFFYGPDRVPYTAQLWQLIPLIESGRVEFVITWQLYEPELMERLPLEVVERSGAFVLLQRVD